MGPATVILLLDELVVAHGAHEPVREDFLQQVQEVTPDEGHSHCGELLEAADGMEMLEVAKLIEEASAPSRLQRGGVTDLGVQQDLRTGWLESRQEEGVYRPLVAEASSALDDCVGI